MQPEFWHDRWEKNQIGFHQQDINFHLQQFWPRLGVPSGSRVFVPLCGKSSDMLWLCAQGYDVVGVELSPLAVQALFSENGLEYSLRSDDRFDIYEAGEIRIYCGDFFDLRADDLVGVQSVFDRASLVALPSEMRSHYVEHLQKILSPGVFTLLVTFDYPQQEMSGPPFSVQEPEVRGLYQSWCTVELLDAVDILDQEPRFRDKGVTRIQEKVYRLTYNP